MDNRQYQQCNNVVPTSSEQCYSQESDIMTNSDIEYLMDDLGTAHNLNIYYEHPEVPAPTNTCDSTHEDTKMFPTNPSSPTGRLPCVDDYPGPHNFELLLDGTTAHKKSWIYSYTLNKVFIDVDKILLVQFHLNEPTPGLRVRALLVYTMADYLNQPVNRCTIHSLSVDPERQAHSVDKKCFCAQHGWVGHVLQTDSDNAEYYYNPESERHSVVVTLEQLQAGTHTFVVPYKFMCKTSCNRGIQRRPMDVIFTLETPLGEVIGRQTFSVKICSCPKRDKEREEKDAEWVQMERGVSVTPRTGKRNMTRHETSKKLKADVATENSVQPHTKDISNHQDFHEMLKRAEELSNGIQSLSNSIQSLSNDLKTRQVELTQLLVELARIAAQKKL